MIEAKLIVAIGKVDYVYRAARSGLAGSFREGLEEVRDELNSRYRELKLLKPATITNHVPLRFLIHSGTDAAQHDEVLKKIRRSFTDRGFVLHKEPES